MTVRAHILILLAGLTLCAGQNCAPSAMMDDGDDGNDGMMTDEPGDDMDTSDDDAGNPDTTIEPQCYDGAYICRASDTNPEPEPCGEWTLRIDEQGGITGEGEIDDFIAGVLDVTLTGTLDTTEATQIVTITGSRGDGGSMSIDFDMLAGTATGQWIATDGIEPIGDTRGGTLNAASCSPQN